MRLRVVSEVVGPDELMAALEAHAFRAQEQLLGGRYPSLYRSGVRYSRPGRDDRWRTPREVLQRGAGHCPDLAAWRVAELRVTGEDPRATLAVRRGGASLGHVVVRRGDGSIEDPSAVLGMRG